MSIDEQLGSYGLRSRRESGVIAFPGFVSERRKNALLRKASLLIYPSLFEGFGLPIAEAMAHGVPCIAAASSSMPEVGDAVCFYFDPFKKGDFRRVLLDTLMTIAHRNGDLAERCRAQADKFSWRTAYDKLSREISSRAKR